MADNYRIDIVNDRREVFEAAMRLAFSHDAYSKPTTAKHWAVAGQSLILLRWKLDSDPVQNFPLEMGVDAAIAFCWDWLTQQKYPAEPDQDGSNKQGFWLTTTDAARYDITSIWNHPGGFHGGIIRITPVWCMYGK